MPNKLIIFIILVFCIFNLNKVNANDQFNFDVSEIEITENGNKIIGLNRGVITSNNGIKIEADTFVYNKKLNFLSAIGNVVVKNNIQNYIISSNKISFFKDDNIILAEKKVKIIDNKTKIINAEKVSFDITNNIFVASGEVIIIDKLNDFKIVSDHITYNKSDEQIKTKGSSYSLISSRLEIKSEDVIFSNTNKTIKSKKKASIKDNENKTLYEIKNFILYLSDQVLKGENIFVNTNYDLPFNEKYYVKSGMFNIKNQEFITQDINIDLKKNIFDNEKNDPRIKGVSSSSKNGVTTINKGIFTTCKKNDNCAPWSIQAEKIEYDKNKKLITYDDALLKIYDKPVFYFPKFFHPGPTVKRQSGFLAPNLGNSNTLGSSVQIPYYWAVSESRDFTFTPSIFSKNIFKLQNEFRQKNKNSSIIADFSFTNGYKSKINNEENTVTHFFSKYNSDLNIDNFKNSSLDISVEKVSNDTYLKIFDQRALSKELKPDNENILKSEIKLNLQNDEYQFESGFISYENLQKNVSDRYEYVLPYYNFSTDINDDGNFGNLSFTSIGDNILKDTNNLRSRIINNFDFKGFNIISKNGLQNNFNFYVKNLTTTGKNDTEYDSSIDNELMGIFEIRSSLPLIDINKDFIKFLEPKISFRFNPSNMANKNIVNRKIDNNNIFELNRLGLEDTLESGKSLTIGIDYKKESLENINQYFELKLGTIIRDKNNNNIPLSSGITKEKSNIFGNITNNFSENISLNYDFSINNNFDKLEYNALGLKLSYNVFSTDFNFIEESGVMGDSNILENTTTLMINENNNLSFKTRQNRKINLTEYYDLIYEYKNDCLVAGITYNKTYYEDRDLQPSEDLMFKLTLIPITSVAQSFSNK